MRIIDFHNHFYPPQYLEAIRRGPSNVRVTLDAQADPELHYPGDYNVAVRGHRDIAYRAEVLERAGIDRQVLTFTTPGTHIEEPARAVQLARLVNDSLARIVSERPARFRALATLPLNDPSASVAEFGRAVTQLGLPGAMLFSNVNGVALADQRYWPLYERAAEHQAVLYIHPTNPVGVEAMTEHWLMPLVGFPMDTTLAAAKLVFDGVARRFPGIRWVLAHLGGAIPYVAERLDRGYEAFADCRRHIDQPPSHYLRRFYFDSVNFDPAALRLAIGFAGVDHILAGSDYPHQIGSLEKMCQSIQALGLSAEDQAKVLGGNTQRLLGLTG
jgi:aminocarboxymuconate-semialdehyde decarboxylase